MRLLLVGPPGSGKGTQAARLAQKLNLVHLATGNLLREAVTLRTIPGLEAEPHMLTGQLVPDDLVNRMVADRFHRDDCPDRFVMDGYPRTAVQAGFFDNLLRPLGLGLQMVLEFVIDDEDLVRRLSNRLVCSNQNCQTPFHLISKPPKVDNICDVCGSPLIQRPDDAEETVRFRLKVYHQTSADLLAHYREQGKLYRVRADQDMDTVFAAMLEQLQSIQ
jgi:adenylate kinase